MSLQPINTADYNKSLPAASSTERFVFAYDANGNLMGKPISEFGCVKRLTVSVGQIVRIGGINSVMISMRGPNVGRCALIWVSTYGGGTKTRTTAIRFYNSDMHYEWYVNGPSETSECVYVKCLGGNGYDNLAVCSLFGELPKVEIVSAVPSDATPLVFANS